MKPLHRILLVIAVALFSAARLPAQHAASGAPCPPRIGGGYGGNYNYGGVGVGSYAYASPYSGLGGGYSFDSFGGWGFADFGPIHHPQEHAPFTTVAAHGDADFEPSQYMDYDKALELGKKILEQQAAPQPSLGDIARSLRANRHVSEVTTTPGGSEAATPGNSKVTAVPGNMAIVRDTSGSVHLCHGTSDSCRTTT